ncbi:MAG: hypothetical protein IPI43_11360 [Sandaracinaceae bacterium]|nr:hypothetical protein [Sandaracinaceae bacterium]
MLATPSCSGPRTGAPEILGSVLREGMRKRPGTQPPGDRQWPGRSVLPVL